MANGFGGGGAGSIVRRGIDPGQSGAMPWRQRRRSASQDPWLRRAARRP
jgi:hypothetical protein